MDLLPLLISLLLLAVAVVHCDQKLKEKNPLFLNEHDLEKLLDSWDEADEEKLPPDELPAHKRPPPKMNINPENLLNKDPEQLMISSKKGKTVMAFVSVGNKPTREQTDSLTQRWQQGLSNNHIRCERFIVADDRAIFVFQDGIQAFDAKAFLLEQPELKEYTIDNRSWQGKAYPQMRVEL